MVSNYMPSVVVEIAFDSNYATPAASRTWTDVSDYAELHDGIDITVGRQDERSTADANTLTLTLDNSDGRFTALRSASPYYPDVKIGRPIRVKATPPGGSTVTRFVGFIDEWPVEWDGTDAYAKATIRATSRMARLGLTAKLRSMIEEQILSYSPARYFTLGDPSGSTAASESSGNAGDRLTATGSGTAVVFGNATGPATDGLTAVETLAGKYLTTTLPATEPRAIHLTVKVGVDGGPPPGTGTLARVRVIGLETWFTLSVAGANAALSASTIDDTITGPDLNDGATHDVTFTLSNDAGVPELFVDGVSYGAADAVAPGLVATLMEVGSGFTGVLSHVAYFDEDSSLIESLAAAAIAAAVDGFAGDTTDERLLRILQWVGVFSTEVDAETGVETMTYQQTTGQSVVDALHDVESTEGGVLFDGADGNVKFHNRSHRYLAAAAATLDMAAQHVEADYAPRLDRSTLVNDVTVDNPTTGEAARAVDTASSDEYGIATGSATSVANSYTPLGEKAAWLIASYSEPRMRCPSLTVDVLAHQGLTPSAQTLLGITVGDLLALTNAPSQSDTTSPSYFVEGYSETIGPESYFITFNLSPTYPTLNTFVLDDADRGELDAGNLLAY
jgi:hypothetical protein